MMVKIWLTPVILQDNDVCRTTRSLMGLWVTNDEARNSHSQRNLTWLRPAVKWYLQKGEMSAQGNPMRVLCLMPFNTSSVIRPYNSGKWPTFRRRYIRILPKTGRLLVGVPTRTAHV